MFGRWTEIGDGVVVIHYQLLQQNIGLVIGGDWSLLIDTRGSPAQAREILADVQSMTSVPIRAVINTHGHSDHVFGNSAFESVDIWGHAACVPFLAETAEEQRAVAISDDPSSADELRAMAIRPPGHLLDRMTVLDLGDRRVELHLPGRGHTDHDVVVVAVGTGVAFAGDLVVGSDAQFFGHSYPIDWPDALTAVDAMTWNVLVTGHGATADRAYVAREIGRHRRLIAVAASAHRQGIPWEDTVNDAPYPAEIARVALARTYAQLEGRI